MNRNINRRMGGAWPERKEDFHVLFSSFLVCPRFLFPSFSFHFQILHYHTTIFIYFEFIFLTLVFFILRSYLCRLTLPPTCKGLFLFSFSSSSLFVCLLSSYCWWYYALYVFINFNSSFKRTFVFVLIFSFCLK